MSPGELWGVGQYEGPGGRVSWPISHDEMRRDMAAAPAVLRDLGVGAGDRVLHCSMLSEAGQCWPLIVGTMLVGAQLSCADATHGEAARVAMFLRRMGYRVVLGVSDELLDGLDDLGRDYGTVFGAVPVVGARPGAYERLVAAGLTPHRFVLCGPAVALGREPGAPAAVDVEAWDLDADAGRILVTNRRARARAFDRTPTAVTGALIDAGVVPDAPVRADRSGSSEG